MKSIVNRVVTLLVIVTLTSVMAFANTTEKEVPFTNPVTVNGTVIKKGSYKVAFNDETGELTIRKGRKILATAQARLEKTTDRYSFYTHSASGDSTQAPALVSVYLKDGNLATIVAADSKTTSSRQ